jgi:ABC-type uncharacterized transport system permease subunit
VVTIVLILFALPALLYGAVWFASWRSGFSAESDRAFEPAVTAGGAATMAGAGGRGGAPGAPGADPAATREAHDALASAARWMLPLAVILHGLSLFWPLYEPFRFGFAKALSATLWIGLALLWFEGLSLRVDALRLLTLPLAIVALLLPLGFPGIDFSTRAHLPLFVPHLIVGTLAYGVLLLAVMHALLMIAVQWDLQRAAGGDRGPLSRWIDRLPPLMALERLLFRLIGLGFVLLLLTTLSGLLFSERVFGTPLRLDHKTVFSLVALGFFGVLLAGRRVHGWRGRIAMRFTLIGFGLLMLGYIGSRFVLEVVLKRM